MIARSRDLSTFESAPAASADSWGALADVRAVLFDLGGTVISIDHPRVERYLADAGWPPDPGWVRRAESAGRRAADRLVRAGADPAEQWRGFFHAFLGGAGAAAEAIDPVFRRLEAFHRRQHLWNRPLPEAVRALGALAGLGYRVAAVSNSDGRAEELLGGLGLAREFEFVVDSTHVGIEKPDPRIFRLACARLGLAPERCAYVGDLLSVDVEGAAGAGLRPVLLDHYGSYATAEMPAGVPRAQRPEELVAALSRHAEGRPREDR